MSASVKLREMRDMSPTSVGTAVGVLVGADVGVLVGAAVVIFVGAVVGAVTGTMVGIPVGACDIRQLVLLP